MKILILVNGKVKNHNWLQNKLQAADVLICADGGANFCIKAKTIPDYVIGDMDSIDKKLLSELENNNKTKVIVDKDQNKTDLQLAIELANDLKPDRIELLGVVGDRLDHTLGNLWCLDKVDKNIQVRALGNNCEISLVQDSLELEGKKGEVVSVIPLTDIEGLTYKGLKWGLADFACSWGWLGVCNKMEKQKATISIKKGKILVIKYLN